MGKGIGFGMISSSAPPCTSVPTLRPLASQTRECSRRALRTGCARHIVSARRAVAALLHMRHLTTFFPRRAQRQVWALRSGCRREPPRRAKLARPAQVVVPGGGFLALASTEVRARIFHGIYARLHGKCCLGWSRTFSYTCSVIHPRQPHVPHLRVAKPLAHLGLRAAVERGVQEGGEEARVGDHGDALLGPRVQPLQEGVRARRDERQLLAPA